MAFYVAIRPGIDHVAWAHLVDGMGIVSFDLIYVGEKLENIHHQQLRKLN